MPTCWFRFRYITNQEENTLINTYIHEFLFLLFLEKCIYNKSCKALSLFPPKLLRRTQEEQRRAAGGRLRPEVQTLCPFVCHRCSTEKGTLSYTFH